MTIAKMHELNNIKLQETDGGLLPLFVGLLGVVIFAYNSADEMAESACQAYEDSCN